MLMTKRKSRCPNQHRREVLGRVRLSPVATPLRVIPRYVGSTSSNPFANTLKGVGLRKKFGNLHVWVLGILAGSPSDSVYARLTDFLIIDETSGGIFTITDRKREWNE